MLYLYALSIVTTEYKTNVLFPRTYLNVTFNYVPYSDKTFTVDQTSSEKILIISSHYELYNGTKERTPSSVHHSKTKRHKRV